MRIRGPKETVVALTRWLVLAAVLVPAGVLLVGCASQADRSKADLSELELVLPGIYANSQQALLVMNVFAPMMTGKVLYMRETAANDERRVFSERIWVLEVNDNDHIVATLYAFTEPERWHDAASDPELFRPMMQRDLRPIPGCELVWQRTPRGFSATGRSPRCPTSWRLEGEELAFSAPASAGGDGYYHFVRQGGEQ